MGRALAEPSGKPSLVVTLFIIHAYDVLSLFLTGTHAMDYQNVCYTWVTVIWCMDGAQHAVTS